MVAIEAVYKDENNIFCSYFPAVNSPPVSHRDNNRGAVPFRPFNDDFTSAHRVEPVQPEPEERTKKDKKWSFGKLFRRKKKDDDTESSSESDEGIGTSTRSPSKRKVKKKKRNPTTVNNFDHIVVRDTRRAQSLAKTKQKELADDGVLSDPSAGFINYRLRVPQPTYGESRESLSTKEDALFRSAKYSLETPPKKTRKGRLKARVEALRNSLRGDSSSEEESLKSSESSMIRFRSEDSLMRSRDSTMSKRSRSARNERYIKRLSRDDENQLNKEAELLQQGYTRAEVEMLTRTPTSQSSGYGTCKRDQTTKPKPENIYANDHNRRPMKSESVSSFPSTQSYPSSINFNAKVNNELVNYSIQYPYSNITKESLHANNNRQRGSSEQFNYQNNDVMCVKFPLGNVTNINREEKAPPVPPPRDMHRRLTTPVPMYYENNSIINDRYENNKVTHGVPNNDFDRVMRKSQERSLHGINGLRRPISTSEDHIAIQNLEHLNKFQYKQEQPRRPASVSAEPNHYMLYANTPPWRKKIEQPQAIRPEPVQPKHDYLYYADQSPRSRRPISIKTSQNTPENQYLSDSQSSINLIENMYRKPRNASDFWKKLDDAERQKKQQHLFANTRSNSDFSSNSQLQRHSQYYDKNSFNHNSCDNFDYQNKNVLRSNSLSRDTTDYHAKMWKATTEYKKALTAEPQSKVATTSIKDVPLHKTDINQTPSDDERSSERRKSTNLDDALNELEAIYNSLGLGDEDLLDRAERRELMTPKFNDQYSDWNGNDDELKLRSQPTTPLRRVPRRSTLPDKLQDDMAFRRLNSKEKQIRPTKDTQAQISYMLASPVYVPYASDDDRYSDRNEPDIVYDDVVYRNIKQANSRLKTLDTQPPFGIPVGPVSPAPQSDYLHATPENKTRSRFVPRKSPDLVSDDLAYRSLRKDNSIRHSTHFNGEDYNGRTNNNLIYNELADPSDMLKKKRAVRSLSANIFTMIQKEIDDALNMSKMATIQKTQSNSDVTKRLRENFENNSNERDQGPRNKVKQRHNTVNLCVNNIHAPPNHHFAKDDSFVHNDERYLLSKPPSCDKSKSSSPSNRSPQFAKRPSKDEFQHVLSMLAQEAMDTSNKLGVALAELDKNRHNTRSDIQNKISDSRQMFLNGLTSKCDVEPAPGIKHVKVHSEIVSEPYVFDNKESKMVANNLKAKKTEDSLMAISDQLHKVEDQLKHSYEKEINFENEGKKLKKYITETEDSIKAQETTVVEPKSNSIPKSIALSAKKDCENKDENKVTDYKKPNSADETINKISGMNAFHELKDGISDLIAGISQVSEKLSLPKHNAENVHKEPVRIAGISEVNEKLNQVIENTPTQPLPHRGSVNLSIYENDLEMRKETTDSTEYNSSEELATIFKDRQEKEKTPVPTQSIEGQIRTDLSSPKLVQTMNQQLRRISVDNSTDECKPSQSNSLPKTNVVPWRTKRQNNSQLDNRDDGTQSKSEWHQSPSTLMLAYSYTVMFTQHLADLDWLTLLGVLLAMITIIAMMML